MSAGALASPPTTWLLSAARLRLRPDLYNSVVRACNFSFTTSLNGANDPPPSLRAIRATPYPTTPLDDSLFEPEETDAHLHTGNDTSTLELHTKHTDVSRPDSLLARLVHQRRWKDAARVHAELLRMGAPIFPNSVYDSAALHVLSSLATSSSASSSSSSAPSRTESFTQWWSLAPDYSPDERSGVPALRRAVLEAPHFDAQLSFVHPFAVLAVQKGYARTSEFGSVALISTCCLRGSPDASARLLGAMAAALRERDAREGVSTRRTTRTLKHWFYVALKTHALAGRAEAAVEVVKISVGQQITPERASIAALLALLRKGGRRLAELEIVLRGVLPGWIFEHSQSEDVKLTTTIPTSSSTSQLPPFDPPAPTAPLSAHLRHAKHLLSHLTPLPLTLLADTLASLSRHSRPRALLLLAARAERHGPRALSRYALGLMLSHAQMHQPYGVLRTFKTFCVLVGVPERDMAHVLRRRRPLDPSRLNTYRGGSPVSKSSLVEKKGSLLNEVDGYRPREKVYPSAAHTALVWAALVYVSRAGRFEALYARLLEHVRASRSSHASVEGQEAAAKSRPLFDGAHFQPFVARHAHRFRPERALSVLRDMSALSVSPSAENLSVLAGGYAKVGDARAAEAVLDAMDELGGERRRERLVAATGVLRGLLDRRRYEDARRVANRLQGLMGSDRMDERVEVLLRWAREEQVPAEVMREHRSRRKPVRSMEV